jgi:hypothetical protein
MKYLATLATAATLIFFVGFLYVFNQTAFFGPPSIVAPVR